MNGIFKFSPTAIKQLLKTYHNVDVSNNLLVVQMHN